MPMEMRNGKKGNGIGNKNDGNENNDDFDEIESLKTLVCPAQCPQKKPKKGCHVDCSSKCDASCKYIKVRPIGQKENLVHNNQLPVDDAFTHLETQFRFKKLSDLVEGILGKTNRPDYVNPVKIGVPMPMMGGEDKYETPSLSSPLCRACRFRGQSDAGIATI
ncbi:hypothetical protein GH714_002634 [Hevea brasiliensis]|uniref:Uncharacterized protein n=1 Tax=Hevea brasiliensis TaxID=3981 RepID=A0A6A6NBU9_HEVBR|nr:hypothetical protein GH714_002634 [Hevea brasiliensis]